MTYLHFRTESDLSQALKSWGANLTGADLTLANLARAINIELVIAPSDAQPLIGSIVLTRNYGDTILSLRLPGSPLPAALAHVDTSGIAEKWRAKQLERLTACRQAWTDRGYSAHPGLYSFEPIPR